MKTRLERLTTGQLIPYGGDRATAVSEALASAFQSGDRLIVVQETGDLLHIPAKTHAIAQGAVDRAVQAFHALGGVSDAQITDFFEQFAARLADDGVWDQIAQANADDVERAKMRGRSTTRLMANPAMRKSMIEGLRQWRDASATRNRSVETVGHDGWSVEQVTAPLGVVGFVFEGRPNVFADATGVIRTGNTVVFRIGSDALGTARAITQHALDPALAASGLPAGAASLIDSAEHAAGYAMFSDKRLALAVARGSGPAVAQLGAVARQAGVPVSLHGTGGAWLFADATADATRFEAVVETSLDRKVCNTLNTCCIVRERAGELVPLFLAALERAADRRGQPPKVHVTRSAQDFVPASWFDCTVDVIRAEGIRHEQAVELIGENELGREWEWEESPEVSLYVVESLDEAITAFNAQSPRFAASLISADPAAHERFFQTVDAPFVGNGFTRWVDGQYAFNRPELGLSNWENGRLFARGGVLAGDSVFTVRARMRQDDLKVRR